MGSAGATRQAGTVRLEEAADRKPQRHIARPCLAAPQPQAICQHIPPFEIDRLAHPAPGQRQEPQQSRCRAAFGHAGIEDCAKPPHLAFAQEGADLATPVQPDARPRVASALGEIAPCLRASEHLAKHTERAVRATRLPHA